MSFPTRPTNGQIYGNKKYNSTKNVWENCLQLPIGFIYTQLPGKPDPATLYGGSWKNISSNYSGSFLRIEGGNASTFEKSLTISTATTTVLTFTTTHDLAVGSPVQFNNEVRFVSIVNSTTQVTVSVAYSTVPSGSVLTGQGDAIRNITGYAGGTVAYGYSGAFYGSTSRTSLDSGGYGSMDACFDASRVVPTAADNRPVNYTVRIWERIS